MVETFDGRAAGDSPQGTNEDLANANELNRPQKSRGPAFLIVVECAHVELKNEIFSKLMGLSYKVDVVEADGEAENSQKIAVFSSPNLTPREAEVLRLVAEGNSNPDIAKLLHVTVRTVRHHVSELLRKFGVPSRTALAARYLKEQGRAAKTGHMADVTVEVRMGSSPRRSLQSVNLARR